MIDVKIELTKGCHIVQDCLSIATDNNISEIIEMGVAEKATKPAPRLYHGIDVAHDLSP